MRKWPSRWVASADAGAGLYTHLRRPRAVGMMTAWLQPGYSILSVERTVLVHSGPCRDRNRPIGVIRPRSTADWDHGFLSAAGWANHLVAKQSLVRWDKPIGANGLDKEAPVAANNSSYSIPGPRRYWGGWWNLF